MALDVNDQDLFREVLDRKKAELLQALRRRDAISIEKSPDQTDEIQYAYERDLAIRNLDRESSLLRQVLAALRRINDGDFGTCLRCDGVIGARRLAAVPWAECCIQCQEAADGEETGAAGNALLDAA